MASLPLDVCVALSNCSDFSETQHHHIQGGLLTSSPDGWYEDLGIFKSQAGTQVSWLLCICSQNTVSSIGAVTLISYNCLFHLWFPTILFRERKVSYQLIFASFILQRPSEEEAFIKYFWKEGKNELIRRVIKWLKAFTLESNWTSNLNIATHQLADLGAGYSTFIYRKKITSTSKSCDKDYEINFCREFNIVFQHVGSTQWLLFSLLLYSLLELILNLIDALQMIG